MNVKLIMLIASFFGAFIKSYFINIVKPGIDFSYWLAAFAILGIGVGNLVFLVFYKFYQFLKTK